MNNEQKAKLIDDLIYSDGFDEILVYRLKMSLEDYMESLEGWSKKKDLWQDKVWQDYVEALKYCRSLVCVLQWFTIDEYRDEIVQLNRYSLKLEEIF